MSSQEERSLILEMIESGKVTPAEGLRLLQALGEVEDESGLEEGDSEHLLPGLPGPVLARPPQEEGTPAAHSYQPEPGPAWSGADPQPPDSAPAVEPDIEPETYVSPPPPPGAESWRRWWMIPLWIGVGVTVVGALILYAVQRAAGVNFWFFCAGLPFLLGVALIALAWGSRTARWIHIRVDQAPGDWPRRIALSFPLPLSLTAWFLRTFRSRIPGLEGTVVDEVVTALKSAAAPGSPFYIHVEDDEDGERVEIFIA